MSGITSHVLDTSLGKPASGIRVLLELNARNGTKEDWTQIGEEITNEDGRVPGLTTDQIAAGHYRITFFVADYFKASNVESFYPMVKIQFSVVDAGQHFHVPLLLNPFGYSTYRGS